MTNKNYLISAIVSVYNGGRFIAGCLEDLEQQSIADRLEIIVVNSGSQQNDEAIINKFRERYNNIVYIKTENRETLYQAWNRGIKAASGKYITNANSDDRHRKDAFEIMVSVLENDKNIVLVYADDIITKIENETFEDYSSAGFLNWTEFNRFELLRKCYIGPHPMWIKKIHEEFGYFDEDLKVAGDYEFWLRISKKNKCKHISEYLGLYLKNPKSLERRDEAITIRETAKVMKKYKIEYKVSYRCDRPLLNATFKDISNDWYKHGYNYFIESNISLAKLAFFQSLTYNLLNYRSFRGLLACYIHPKIVRIIRKGRIFLKLKFYKNKEAKSISVFQ